MKEFIKSNLFLKITSVVIAVILWLYVVQFENPEFQVSVSDIPVKYENEQTITDKQLMITSQNKQAVTLKIKGKRQTISKLDKSDILAVIDLKSITAPGEYNLPVKVSFSGSNLVVADSSMPRVKITVENKVEHEYKVKVKTSGKVKAGYYAVPDSAAVAVRVISPESMAHLAAYAQAELDITGAESTVEGSSPVKLYDENGNEVNSRYIRCEPSSAAVRCFVYPTKEVPVTWRETGAMPAYGSSPVPSEKTLTLAGPENLLSEIDSVNLGNIDLSTFSAANNLKFIALDEKLIPEGVYVAGDTKSLTLTMNFNPPAESNEDKEEPEEDKTTHVTVKNILTEGIPEGFTAEILTSSISVKISGDKNKLSDVSESDITATVDLSGLTEEELSKSEHELPVTLTSSKEITFDETKYVKVRITPVEPAAAIEEPDDTTAEEQH